jgi:hypothetical protein
MLFDVKIGQRCNGSAVLFSVAGVIEIMGGGIWVG